MAVFESCNPATGERIGVYPVMLREEAECAVERAELAGKEWAARTVRQRCESLLRLRDSLATEAETLAHMVTLEIGKPLQESYGADILPALNALGWLAKNAPAALKRQKIRGRRQTQLYAEPLGVVGVIGTWNYPIYLNVAPIAWALAAGNAVVWKPSELATESALALSSHFERAGLPVFTITGDAATGRALCNAGVDKLAFTGSVATGRAILAELAKQGIPSVMELSGNDAMIVCADADVRLAAQSAVWGRCCNAGQSCVAPQRIYVHRVVEREFLMEVKRVLDSLRPGEDYGPLRTEELRSRTNTMVRDAISRGAALLAGGYSVTNLSGFYYAPTLLAGCDEGMLAVDQDFFGPVLPVCTVASDAEAIERANSSDMALGASIWTKNGKHGQEIAQQLRVGFTAINSVLLDAADPALPFGGSGASGFGKQRGLAGLEEFVQRKVVITHGYGGAHRHLFPYRAATLPILRAAVMLKAAQGPVAKIKAAHEMVQTAMAWDKAEAPVSEPEKSDERVESANGS